MNRRQAKKMYSKGFGLNIQAYCPNWNLSCKYPEEECPECSTYHMFLAKQAFKRMLKREGYTTSGWILAEVPIYGVYIFYQKKKRKEIALETDDNKSYVITVYDFNTSSNKKYDSIADALKSPLHNYFYAPGLHKGGTRGARKQRLIADFCGE